MRQSRHLGLTLRETPKDAQTAAHKLMLRAGYIRQVSAGIYTYLPLLLRTLNKISSIIREEMDLRDSEELLMSAIQPRELWEESGRWERYTAIDGIMFAFEDRRGSTVCLGPTHEEIITDTVRTEVNSYKQLPKILYQIQSKFRDEIRPRFGLMRAREFIMKDAYSFDIDEEGLNRSYQAMAEAYHDICKRIGFEYRAVEADPGAIGGSGSQEFMVIANTGEDAILLCDSCDYAANVEKAESHLEIFEQDKETKPMQEILGEGLIGVEALSGHLNIPIWKTTKTILYRADDQLVAVMVRGDCEVNEIKVQNFLGCNVLQLASSEEIKKTTGAEVGYAGPIGLPKSVRLIADNYVSGRVNFECGANRTNYHSVNVNFGRDLSEPEYGDFKLAAAGEKCPRCKGKLRQTRGIEVGHIFKLGTKYSDAMNCMYLDREGQSRAVVMGCYGIGVSRIAAAAVEQNHDDKGIIWPKNIAPYQVHFIALNLEQEAIKEEAEKIYKRLRSEKIEVLYDDRELRAGEKFSDSDLIGIPVRLTISKRMFEQKTVELKFRSESESKVLSLEQALEVINQFYA
jgi:prolyl-tRNA synthetase